MMRSTGRRQRGRSHAQSMVEFALVIPIFVALIFGIVEGARLIYTYNTINHSSQEAAQADGAT